MPHFGERRGHNLTRIINSNNHEFPPTRLGLQNSITELPLHGGAVWLPPAIITIDQTIDTQLNRPGRAVRIFGAGTGWADTQYGTLLRATAALNPVLDMGGQWDTLWNVGVDGADLAVLGITAAGVDNSLFYVGVRDCTTAVVAEKTHFTISDFWVEYNSYGIQILPGCEASRILNGNFYQNSFRDIRAFGIRMRVLNNKAWDSDYFLETEGDGTAELICKNNLLRNFDVAAYRIKDNVAYLRIENDIFDGEATTPNFLVTEAGAVITDAQVKGCSIRGQTGAVFVYNGDYIDVIKDNYGFNPVGVIATPFDNVGNTFGFPAGGAAGPTNANTDYTCIGVDCSMDVTGGTAVSVTLEDPASAVIHTYGATPVYIPNIPIGFIINFGAFTVAPTVIVSGN